VIERHMSLFEREREGEKEREGESRREHEG
jgi:hypothetical protein